MAATVPDEVAKELAARYGVASHTLERLAGGEPWSHGVRYTLPSDPPALLKVHVAAREELAARLAVAERLSMLAALTAGGAPLPTILPSVHGQLLETVDEGATSYWAYAMRRVPGVPLADVPRETWGPRLDELGRTLARLHHASRRLPAWSASPTRIHGCPILSWRAEWQHVADRCHDPAVAEVWRRLGDELARLPIERDGFGFVHNDPHLRNVLIEDDQLALVDLDVATYHWFVVDLAATTYSITSEGGDDALAREHVERFLDAYLAVHALADRWMDTLPLFLRYRRALRLITRGDELPPARRDTWRAAVLGDEPVLPWLTPSSLEGSAG